MNNASFETDLAVADPPDKTANDEQPLWYRDGVNIVFTAAYHLKRGSCCGSGCRHCPYDGIQGSTQRSDAEDGASR